jgi:hypothetical protein
VTGTTKHEMAHLGIFWMVQTSENKAKLLASGYPIDQAEPYGDCLTYGPSHYKIWAQWRRDKTVDPDIRAVVRFYEYEDWPRGRVVFDSSRDLFVLYADRKLMTPELIARIRAEFHLPEERTEVKSDFHYQSKETPDGIDGITSAGFTCR